MGVVDLSSDRRPQRLAPLRFSTRPVREPSEMELVQAGVSMSQLL